MLRSSCESCGKRYKVDDKFAGKKMRCRECGASVRIPELTASSAPEEKKDLEETVELDAETRAELDRTRPTASREFQERRGEGPARARRPVTRKTGRSGKAAVAGKRFGPSGKKVGKLASRGRRPAARRALSTGEGDEAPEETRSRSTRLILVSVLSILIVGAGVAVAYLKVFSPATEEPPPAAEKNTPEVSTGPDTEVTAGVGTNATDGGEPGAAGERARKPSTSKLPPIPNLEEPGSTEAVSAVEGVAAPKAALSLIPARVDLVAYLDLPRLLELGGPDSSGAAEQFGPLLDAAGMELSDLPKVWLGAVLPPAVELDAPEAAAAATDYVAIFEGIADEDDVLKRLQQHGLLTMEAEEHGNLTVYRGQGGSAPGASSAPPPDGTASAAEGPYAMSFSGAVSFLGTGQAIVTTDRMLGEISQLVGGETGSVQSGGPLAEVVGGLPPSAMAWIAVTLPENLRESLRVIAKDLAEKGGIALPDIEGGLLTIDSLSEDGGLDLHLSFACPSEEEAQKGFQTMLGLRAMLGMFAEDQESRDLLKKLVPKVDGRSVEVAFRLTQEELEKLQAAEAAESADMLPPGLEEDGPEEGEDGAADVEDLLRELEEDGEEMSGDAAGAAGEGSSTDTSDVESDLEDLEDLLSDPDEAGSGEAE